MTHTVVVVPYAAVLLEPILSSRWGLAFFLALPLMVPVGMAYRKVLEAMRGPGRSSSFAFGRSMAFRTMPIGIVVLSYAIAYFLLGLLGDM